MSGFCLHILDSLWLRNQTYTVASAPAIEYTRVALGCTLPPVWLEPTGVYLIKFLIGNLS